jgi:hypothetical protein
VSNTTIPIPALSAERIQVPFWKPGCALALGNDLFVEHPHSFLRAARLGQVHLQDNGVCHSISPVPKPLGPVGAVLPITSRDDG